MLQPRVGLPVVQIDLPQTTDDELMQTTTHQFCLLTFIDATVKKIRKWNANETIWMLNCLKYLKFLVVKRLEQMLWDEFVEALLKGEELGLDASHEPPVDVQPERDTINHQRNVMEDTNSLSIKSSLFIHWEKTLA